MKQSESDDVCSRKQSKRRVFATREFLFRNSDAHRKFRRARHDRWASAFGSLVTVPVIASGLGTRFISSGVCRYFGAGAATIFSKRRSPRDGPSLLRCVAATRDCLCPHPHHRAGQGRSPEHKPDKLLVLRQRRFWLPHCSQAPITLIMAAFPRKVFGKRDRRAKGPISDRT
jgi:hypothetical protein